MKLKVCLQLLPLHIYEPAQVRMIQQLLQTDSRIFGVVTNSDGAKATVGTTAEVVSVKQEHDELIGLTMVTVKAVGRQRFELKKLHGSETGVLLGDVLVIEDIHFFNPAKLFTRSKNEVSFIAT